MTPDAPSTQGVAPSRQTIKRVGLAIRNFATSEVGGRAKALAGLLLTLLFAINGLNVLNSYVGRDFMTAIEHRNGRGFVTLAMLYLAVFAASTVAAVLYRFVEERLALLWREFITRRAVGLYLDGRSYYQMTASGAVANPDQRIADDVRSFTASTLSLSLVFLNGTLTILAFSGVLWSISRVLFLVAVGYATLGSLLAVALGRPLVRLSYDQADREASFRADLVHVRENAESVALLHREAHLRARLLRRVDALVTNLRRIIAVNRNLGFFTTGYNYLIQLIPVLIVAPLFINGSAEFGVISQSSMAFAHVLGAFSLVVNQFPQLSSYAVVLARLMPLVEAWTPAPAAAGITVAEDERRFALEQVTLRAPHDGPVLVRQLSLEVPAGGRLLVTGPSELATTALLRAVAGLWEDGEGRIVRPPLEHVFLLPDRPYLPPGTLRELIAASGGTAPAGDDRAEARVWEALATAGVDAAIRRVGGLDLEGDWDDALSLEEQRLVGVARLLLAAPRLVVLARPAGLGIDRAEKILTALAERGVAYVALGDGALAREHFDAVVEIAPDGTCTRTDVKETT